MQNITDIPGMKVYSPSWVAYYCDDYAVICSPPLTSCELRSVADWAKENGFNAFRAATDDELNSFPGCFCALTYVEEFDSKDD